MYTIHQNGTNEYIFNISKLFLKSNIGKNIKIYGPMLLKNKLTNYLKDEHNFIVTKDFSNKPFQKLIYNLFFFITDKENIIYTPCTYGSFFNKDK